MRPITLALIVCGVLLFACSIWAALTARVWTVVDHYGTDKNPHTNTVYKNLFGTPVWLTIYFGAGIVDVGEVVPEGPVNAKTEPHGRWTTRTRIKGEEWTEIYTWHINGQPATEAEFRR